MSFLSDVYFNSSAFASHHFISLVYCCRAPASLLCLILCSAEAVSPSHWYFNLLYENLPWSAILSYHGSRVLLLPMLSEAQLLLSRLNLVALTVLSPSLRANPISSYFTFFLSFVPLWSSSSSVTILSRKGQTAFSESDCGSEPVSYWGGLHLWPCWRGSLRRRSGWRCYKDS